MNKSLVRLLMSFFAITILISLVSIASAFGQTMEVSEQEAIVSLAYRLGIIIIAAVFAFIARGFLIRRLNKLMLKESKRAVDPSGKETAKKEVPARQPLNVIEMNVETESPEAASSKNKYLTQAVKGINILFVTNLIITAAYAVGYFYILKGQDEIGRSNVNGPDSSFMLYVSYQLVVILFLIWNIAQFLGSRVQFIATGKGAFRFIKPIITFIFSPFQSFWTQVFAVLVLLHSLLFAFGEPVLILIVIVHLILWYLLRKGGRKRIKLKLLILRVFMMGKASTFTFRRLVRFWKHLGTYFTVVDPSFYKVNWKRRLNSIFPLYIWITFIFYNLVVKEYNSDEAHVFAFLIFLLAIGNIIFVIYQSIRMKLNFMTSPAALTKRLEKLERKPTRADNTFKEMPLMCYDNTWKQAVDGLVDSADVVLMDLRGFSETNKGCEYEVNVLFDSIPANRIVFLGYESATTLIRNLIDKQWEELAENSPNLNIENPYTRLLTITKEDSRDLERIVNVLLESSSKTQ